MSLEHHQREVIELGLENESWRERISPDYPDYRAQVVYAVRHEDAHHVDDVVLRRLRMGISPDRGLSGAETVARLMGEELGWSEGAFQEELERFRDRVAAEIHPARALPRGAAAAGGGGRR